MTQPTLPWPDLSAYNLLLTVTHDKAGNRALVMRPSDPEEKSEKTSARVNALAPKIDQICQKIGNGQLKSTVWRSQYLVFTGPMVKNQALMNRFFGRLFPKSSTIPLTLGQAESSEMVRQQAMKLFAKEKAGPNTLLDDEELVQALPNGMDYARDDGVVVISTPNQPPVTINTASTITNEAARYFIEDALNQYLVTVNTDDIDLLRERLVNLNKSLKTDNLSYWSQVITECEVAFLDKEETRLTKTDDLENQVSHLENQVGDLETQNTDLDNQTDEPEKVDLYALRDTLQARLKNQGRVVDGRLVSKIKQLEDEIAQLEVELRVGEPEKDNVQDNDTVVVEFGSDGFRVIGQNTEGETLYENTDGVRSTVSGDFRVYEPVTLVPTRAGMAKRPSARNNSWLIVEEALDAAPAGLSYEDMVRAAFATRVTKDDAHYWKPLSINHDGRSNQYLVRARERGAPKGELELITLNNAGANWMVSSERLSATNERILGALPYPAPKVLIGLWENAGFYVADSEQQNDASTANDDGSGANIENKQLNSEADHANDSTQSEDTGTGTDTGEPGHLGGAGGLPGGSGATDGNAGSTTDDLLELGQQPGSTGQSEQPEQQPQFRGGEGRTEPTESVTGQNVDAEPTSERRAGGRAGVGGGSDGDTGAGAELPGTTEPVPRQPSTGGDNGAISGRDGGTDTPIISGADSGDLFSPGGAAAEETDGTDARPGTAGTPAADAATGNPGDSGTPDLDGLGQPVSTASGSESDVPEPGNADANPGSGADQDGHERADSEPDWESFAESDTFDDFAQHERFYAGSDENPRGASARLRDNITAIMRLRELEDSGATPTMEDREVLAAYSGFGGIHAQLFARHTYGLPDWVNNANKTLMEMASDRTISRPEFSSMRSTILNAHYTHSGIIEPMWEALDRFNVPLARTLEPSSGTLQFKSFMPKALESKVSHMTGVEIDPLTARLAQAIHPDATVIGSGFEKTSFPDNFFDCVISNVPFGDYNVFDPQNPLRKESIHNAFFLKGLDKVRPGGVVAFLTSSYVLDASDNSVRKDIMDQAHVVGAVRLPTGTFDKTTGTSVVTDILFLQKKGDFEPNYTPLNITDVRATEAPLGTASPMEAYGKEYEPGDMVPHQKINQVYAEHPENVLGELRVMSSQHGPALRVIGGGSVSEQRETLRAAFASLPSNLPTHSTDTVTPEDIARRVATSNDSRNELADLPGALVLEGDNVLVVAVTASGDIIKEKAALPKSAQKRVAATIIAMTSLAELMDLESKARTPDENAALEQRRASAKQDANALIRLSDGKNPLAGAATKVLAGDARFKLLQGAISVDTSNKWSLADVYSKRTVKPTEGAPTEAENLEDALGISLAYTATLSETYIARLLSHLKNPPTPADIRAALVDKDLALIDPLTNKLEERAIYLSGNLRPKITAVENIVNSDPSFQKNLDALKAALPKPLKPSQIKVGLDAFWLPEDVMQDFLGDALGFNTSGSYGIKPVFDSHNRHWRLESASVYGKTSLGQIANQQEHLAKTRWGTTRRTALELLENGFTNTIPKVQDPIPFSTPTRYQINAPETLKAQNKLEEIADVFDRWVFKSPQRAQRLADIYNERFNTWVMHDPDGSHMVYPGMSEAFTPYKHQNDFIWRAVSGRNAMTAHVVGAGKTMQLIGSAIRGKQMGRWNKPLVVVPNHMLEQFTNDGHEIYPGAKILAMSAADARADNRATFAARCAMGDWDMVVCTHSVFEKITIPIEVQARLISRELTKLRAGLEAERDGNDGKGKTPKDIEKAIVRLEESLERTMHAINDGNENILNLQQIGIDFIGVDEAHYYKNLMVDTSKQIPGISNASSKRAMNMLFKSQYMHDLHGGPYGVMMATGTPISNSVTECYTFTRMLRPDLLDGMGIKNFNDWMGLFGEIKHGMEIKPEGGGYHMKSRLSRFKNIPELVKSVRTFIDFKSREDLKLPTPDIVEQQIVAKPSPMMKDYMKYIEARARTVRAAKGDSKEAGQDIADLIRSTVYRANDKTVLDSETGEIDPDAVTEPTDDIMLTIATDGRKASLDLRMIHPKFDDHPGSKVNLCVKKCIEIYHQFDEHKAAQMLFCDFSSPTGKGLFNVYDDIKAKLVAAGIPEHEIAFIHDAKSDADKEKLFAKVRSGEVRFLLGSTQKMGVGTNVQERLIAMHQLDAPWKPSDVEQRLGRMDRQGNMFETAYNFTYLTEDSFDLFMWETLNRKLKMIRQAMQKPEDCARELDEETELGYEDILAVTTGNTAIKEFLETRVEMDKLKRMSDSHTDQQADLAARINQQERRVEGTESLIARKVEEQKTVNNSLPLHIEFVGAEPGLRDGPMCSAGGMAGLTEAIAAACERAQSYRDTTIGKFGGLELIVSRMAGEPSLQVMRAHGKAETVFRFISQQDLLVSKQDAAEAALIGGASKEPETPKDENREAAKALARYVNKIARDNDIEPSMEALSAMKENLKNLRDDLGRPFEYEDKMIAVRKRFDELSVELGSEIDADKSIDPAPLISLAARIEEQTGDYAGLESRAGEFASRRPKQAVRHDLDEDMAMLLDDDYDDQDDLTIG